MVDRDLSIYSSIELFGVIQCYTFICYGCASREGLAVYSFVAGPHESSFDDYFVL